MVRPSPVAIVVGGGHGIGRATAQHLAGRGWSVGVVDLDRGAGDRVAAEVAARGGRATVVEADATDAPAMDRVVEQIEDELGPVAGAVLSVFRTTRAPLDQWDGEQWRSVLDVGVSAAFAVARAVVPRMARRGAGSLVFVSSIQARFGFPLEPAYAAGKAGMEGLARQLAVEHGPDGIRVNCVAPALVLVDRNASRWADRVILDRHRRRFPLRRVGRPDDVARAIGFLLSSDADFITGVTLPVDGGLAVRPPSLGDEDGSPGDGDGADQ